jgi:Xaa-Pro aminopeptidase
MKSLSAAPSRSTEDGTYLSRTPSDQTGGVKNYDLSKDVFSKMRYFKEGGCTHFVGMATHDSDGPDANFNGPLLPGMVIACDTFTVFPEEDLGVRIEDTVLITEDGYDNLSKGLPREIEEIEALMKSGGILQMIEK